MTVTVRELTQPEQLHPLRGILLDYSTVITDILQNQHDIHFAPEDLLAGMFDDLSVFLPPDGRSFVAETETGDVLGTGFLKTLPKQRIELKRLYVRDAARGQGVGRLLLDHAMDAARGMGAVSMCLDTLSALKPAIAMYKSAGFRITGSYPESQVTTVKAAVPHATFMEATL